MAVPSVTYTFVNGAGNVIDADEVNQNFTDLVGAFAAGTSDISVDTIEANSAIISAASIASIDANNIVTDTLEVGSFDVTTTAIGSIAVSAIAAYDYTDTVRTAMSYVTGAFTAVISGITNGNSAGSAMEVNAYYTKNGDVVTLYIKSHAGYTNQTGIFPNEEPVLYYTICNLPDDITPSAQLEIDMPLGVVDNGSGVFSKNINGIFGASLSPNSALSQLEVCNEVTYWGPGGSSTKGYNKDITLVYKLNYA